MGESIGPTVTISRSCFDCKYRLSESYRVQSDWGFDHYCTHPEGEEEKRYIGESSNTPNWCPVLLKEEKCITCKGAGKYRCSNLMCNCVTDWHKCHVCKGTGKVQING